MALCRCRDRLATDGHFPLRLEQSGGYGAACPGQTPGGEVMGTEEPLLLRGQSLLKGQRSGGARRREGAKGPCLKVSTALAPAQAPGKDLVAQAEQRRTEEPTCQRRP